MVSKGQGSAEYLIILAAVLIVALVALMLVGAFPSFGSDARESQSKEYWIGNAKPFAIPEHTQSNGTMRFIIQNIETDRLVITNITIGNASIDLPNGITMGGGAKKVFNVTGLPACEVNIYDSYEYDVAIHYNASGVSKTQYSAKPLIGKCVFD
jgi:hypothetical protein